MISAHELHNLVAEDVGPWGNPYDAMLDCANKTNALLERIAISSEMQRERPRPTIVPLSTAPFATTVSYRVVELVISCTGAATVGHLRRFPLSLALPIASGSLTRPF
jgi:hypothetical protein